MRPASVAPPVLPGALLTWAATAWWTVHVTTSVWVPLCVLVASVLTVALHPDARPGVRSLALLAGWLVLAAWVVATLTVLQDHSGDVLWILPTWAPVSGTEAGGPVTTGRLLLGTELALRALTHVGLLGLLLTVVPGTGWSRMADLLLGGAARWVRPLCFVGDAVERVHAERTLRVLSGHQRLNAGGGLATMVAHAKSEADSWDGRNRAPRSSLAERLHVVIWLVLGLLFTWAAVERRLTPAAATLLVVAAGAAAGLLLRVPLLWRARRCGRRGSSGVVPGNQVLTVALVLVSAALLAVLVLAEGDQTWPAMATLLLPVAFVVTPPVRPRETSEVTS